MSIIVKRGRPTEITPRMESICRSLVGEGEIDAMIAKLKAERGLKEEQRLWIMWKASQIQAGRNIIGIALNGLTIMGVEYDGEV